MPAPRRSAEKAANTTVERATRYLRSQRAGLRTVIDRVGPYRPTITRDPFIALIGSIVHQQVSLSAGLAVFRQLKCACPQRRLTPRAVLSLSEHTLQTLGLSRQKRAYVRNVAQAFFSRQLTAPRLRRMSDDEVIDATTAIKGVGRWTAEMLLIFSLERPDVWPVDDLGLRKGVQQLLQMADLPTRLEMSHVGERWRPYRTMACWYLWASLEGPRPPSVTG